jgi:hypothetical protein
LFTHPDVNAYFTTLKDQPKDQIRNQVQTYLDNNPQTKSDLAGHPPAATRHEGSLPVIPLRIAVTGGDDGRRFSCLSAALSQDPVDGGTAHSKGGSNGARGLFD